LDSAATHLFVVDLAVEPPDPTPALLLMADPAVERPDLVVALLLVADLVTMLLLVVDPAVERPDPAAVLPLVADPVVERLDPVAELLLVADPTSDAAAAHGWARRAYPRVSLFCFFIQLTKASRPTTSVKAMINHDLSTEADAETAPIKAFCPPQLSFL
jgi:hypothetical protein